MSTFFDIETSQLAQLNDEQAVDFFRRLLHAEARRIGIPIAGISVSSQVNVGDGGIDASVSAAGFQGDLIRAGSTCYQIKTGSYKPWQPAKAKKLIFGESPPDNPTQADISPSVKKCLDDDGNFVVVCFGDDPVDSEQRAAIDNLKNLVSAWYPNAKVEVFGQNKILGFCAPFLSLKMLLNKRAGGGFLTRNEWANSAEMKKPIVVDTKQSTFIEEIRDKLRANIKTQHLRILGEPGIGKTRSVLEATGVDDLGSELLYFEDPDRFIGKDVETTVIREDSVTSTILVVDECDNESAAAIWRNLAHLERKMSLVTIYNDDSQMGGSTETKFAEPLEEEKVAKIIEGYNVPENEARDWARLCDGSPRVAHVIGWNLTNNPDNPLNPSDTGDLWKRYVAYDEDFSSPSAQQAFLVLRYVALFRRFGFRAPLQGEAKAVHALLHQSDPAITWDKFQEIVQKLRKRKILQGGRTFYITPKAFHIWLWCEWWNSFGDGFSFQPFSAGLGGQLLSWFHEMFKYAGLSNAAGKVVQHLLGPDGPFAGTDFIKSDADAYFFLALSQAAPEKSLRRLQLALEKKTKADLDKFETGRRQAVSALQAIAYKRDLFQEAAELLLRLAISENERWANNATGTFADLFVPGWDGVAASAAEPTLRYPVLKKAILSRDPATLSIVISACEHALESMHFSKMGGIPRSGMEPMDKPWRPKTWSELFDWYRAVWELLRDNFESFPEAQKQKGLEVLVHRGSQLLRVGALKVEMLKNLESLATVSDEARKLVIRDLQFHIRYREKDSTDDEVEVVKTACQRLEGHAFDDRLKRRAGIRMFEHDEEEQDRAKQEVSTLATEALSDPAALARSLPWLLSSAAENGFDFGEALSRARVNWDTIWPSIVREAEKLGEECDVFFAAGFLKGVLSIDRSSWLSMLEQAALSPSLVKHYPELVWRTSFEDTTARRILDLLAAGKIEFGRLGMFGMGGVVNKLSETMFAEWCDALMDSSPKLGGVVAIQQFYFYYLHRKSQPIPKEGTLKLLTHSSLLKMDKDLRKDKTMVSHYWALISKEFLQQHPSAAKALLDVVLLHIGDERSVFGDYHSEAGEVLQDLAMLDPLGFWESISKRFLLKKDSRAFRLRQWLRDGGFGSILATDKGSDVAEAVFKWADEDPDNRLYWLAGMVSPHLGKESMARELLVRYGDKKEFRNSLGANFGTEGWVGSAREHFRHKKEHLERQLQEETDPNVRKFLRERIEIAEYQMERAEIEEEREF